MKIFASVKNPGKYFGAYETPEGSFTIPASARFADAEYAQRAIQRGMNLGQTVDGTWIVFAKGEGLTALLEG